MKKTVAFFIGVAVLLVIGGVFWALRPAPEASEPLTAISIATATSAPTTAPQNSQANEAYPASTSAPEAYPAANNAPEAYPAATQAPAPAADPAYPAPTETGAGSEAPVAAAGSTIFTLSASESYVQFSIDEILRNNPFTAVGVTNQVAAEIAIDFNNPSQSILGPVLVNARTLRTDSEFRDNAIANQILQTGRYEFIQFTPTALEGMPETVAVGDTLKFNIIGDLTIRDVTAPATFAAEIKVVSEQRLEGKASAVVLRSVYGLQIPQVQSVAGVDDDVLLEIVFAAVPK